MWVYQCKADGKYMALMISSNQIGANAADFLGSFSAALYVMAMMATNKLGSGISRAGCWAHARRKFIEAEPTDPELRNLGSS